MRSIVADATACDNYMAVSAGIASKLGSGEGVDTITLDYELNGGKEFVYVVLVRNFLGITSAPSEVTVTRAEMAIPTVTILAIPLLVFRKSRCCAHGTSSNIAPLSSRCTCSEACMRVKH